MIDYSNYWDDFEERVKDTVECLKRDELPCLKRLTIHLTKSCNFNCEYCNMKQEGKFMKKELCFKVIDELPSGTIHFTGGEPTIHPDIQEICAYAKSKGLTVSCNTNGFKLIDTSNIDKLKTSFDSPYENEFNRMIGVNAFRTVVNNLREYSISMKDKLLSITAVLNKRTYKDMIELAGFINYNFKVYNLYYSNYKGCKPELAFTDEEVKDLFNNYIPRTLNFFKSRRMEYSFKQLRQYKPSDFKDGIRFSINKTLPCSIQLSEMVIDEEGYCHNCSHLYRDGDKDEGINLKDYSLMEAFKKLKEPLLNNCTCLSPNCLTGCNPNLISFNQAVEDELK